MRFIFSRRNIQNISSNLKKLASVKEEASTKLSNNNLDSIQIRKSNERE